MTASSMCIESAFAFCQIGCFLFARARCATLFVSSWKLKYAQREDCATIRRSVRAAWSYAGHGRERSSKTRRISTLAIRAVKYGSLQQKPGFRAFWWTRLPWRDSQRDARDRLNASTAIRRSEEHTSELQSRRDLVCRLLLEKKKRKE